MIVVYHLSMNQQTFGKTNFSVSPLGFGGAPIGYLAADIDRVARILNLMLDAGVNLIDTAASYPGSEEMIAKTIGHRKGEYLLVSKCGGKLPDMPDEAWSPTLISKTVDRSLKRLNVQQLDVMLLHSCDLKTLQTGGVLEELINARNAGKIRFVGYSGDNDAAAYAASLPDVAVIETSVNIADQANLEKVIPVCVANNVGVLAKRPIANAAWKDVEQQQGIYKAYSRLYAERLAKMGWTPKDLGFADDAWMEVALRFTLSQPGVHCAIIGTQNPDNAKMNIDIANKGALPPDVERKIREAFKNADPGGTWTGQT